MFKPVCTRVGFMRSVSHRGPLFKATGGADIRRTKIFVMYWDYIKKKQCTLLTYSGHSGNSSSWKSELHWSKSCTENIRETHWLQCTVEQIASMNAINSMDFLITGSLVLISWIDFWGETEVHPPLQWLCSLTYHLLIPLLHLDHCTSICCLLLPPFLGLTTSFFWSGSCHYWTFPLTRWTSQCLLRWNTVPWQVSQTSNYTPEGKTIFKQKCNIALYLEKEFLQTSFYVTMASKPCTVLAFAFS